MGFAFGRKGRGAGADSEWEAFARVPAQCWHLPASRGSPRRARAGLRRDGLCRAALGDIALAARELGRQRKRSLRAATP